MSNMDESQKDEAITSLIEAGADITGSVGGAAIGLVMAGPPGALVGGAAGPVIARVFRKVGVEIKERILGKREEVRIGATFTFAAERIRRRLEAGEVPRQDGFFEASEGTRAAAEEILEGVFLAAQREHEERKLSYYSNLLSSLVFDEKVDRYAANVLLKIGQQLTYRQLCLLSLLSRQDEFPLVVTAPPKTTGWQNGMYVVPAPSIPSHFLLAPLEDWKADLAQELNELEQQGILDCEGHYGHWIGSYNHIKVKPLGQVLFRLMKLDEIASSDIEGLVKLLRIEREGP